MSTREDFEAHWLATRGKKKAGHELRRREDQPQVYVCDSANRHWVTYQAATSRQSAKIKALVEALEAGPSLMHTYSDKSACLCSHCEFIRLKNAAIAAAKETP